MRVQNDIDRFDLVIDTVKRLPQLGNTASYLIQEMQDKLVEHRQYITTYGQDLPEVRDWKWNDGKGNYCSLPHRSPSVQCGTGTGGGMASHTAPCPFVIRQKEPSHWSQGDGAYLF